MRWVRSEETLVLLHHSDALMWSLLCWEGAPSLPPSNPALCSSHSLLSLTVSCVLEVPRTHRHCVQMAGASAMMVTLEEKRGYLRPL